MGQKIARSKTTIDVDYFLLSDYPQFQKIKIINNGLLYKSILVNNNYDNSTLILKIFPKADFDPLIYNKMKNKLQEIKNKIDKKKVKSNSYNKFYNISPILKLEDKQRAGIIIRQNFFIDLRERIYTLPYLTKIEKIWIIFQFFYGIYQLHLSGIYHGDLKIENILLTSNNSVFITDISPYKPAYIQIDDIGSYTCYFENANDKNFKSCYLAPERIVDKEEFQLKNIYELTPSMDVFSAGIIFAELLLDENLLDFTKISAYKKNNDIIEQILNKIKDEKIRNLIRKMTVLNPNERIDIKEVLQIMINDICPITMTQMLIHMNNLITTTEYWKPDIMIGLIYKHWRQIWKMIFGLNDKIPLLYQKLNFGIINELTLFHLFKDIKGDIQKNKEAEILKMQIKQKEKIYKLEIEYNKKMEEIKKKKDPNRENIDNKLQMLKEQQRKKKEEEEKKNFENEKIKEEEIITNNNNIEQNEEETKKEEEEEIIFDLLIDLEDLGKLKNESSLDKSVFDKNDNRETLRIIMSYVLHNMDTVKYDSSNLVAIEILKNYSIKFSDYEKLDIIIPYFIANLNRKNTLCVITTINYLFELFYSINYKELILPIFSYKYFDAYIFPAFHELQKSKNNMLILAFINSIDKLIDLEKKFLNCSLKSRIINYNDKISKKNIEEITSNNITSLYQNQKINTTIYESQEKIFHDYDISLKEFKEKLFEYVSDLISSNEEIDVIIALIRQLPALLIFYGKEKTNDFIKFIINNINKTQWIIQREILKYIPQMIVTLGEDALNNYLLTCMEMLISNNSNELKIFELINTILILFKMDYLSKETAIDFYIKLFPFIEHPNINIRNKIIELTKQILSELTKEEIYLNLFNPLKNYLYCPGYNLNDNIIEEYSKERLSRIIYDFELRNISFSEKKIKQIDLNAKTLLMEIISNIKENSFGGNIIYSFNSDLERKIYGINLSEGRNFNEIIPKEFKRFCKNNSEEGANLVTFICKIMWLGDLSSVCSIPKIKTNEDVSFRFDNNSIITSENFKINFLFKTLKVNLKLVTLNDFLNEEKDSNDYKNEIKYLRTIRNNYKSNKFEKWRPQGQLISTLYNHKRKPVEKLISIDNNQFASIDNEAGFFLWNINNDYGEIILNKNFSFNEKNEENLKILYNKTIRIIDNMSFIFASGENLYELNPHLKSTSDFLIKLYENKENTSDNKNNITCSIGFGEDVQESQKIFFSQENGYLNIKDKRMNKIALSTYIPIENGIISCMYKSSNFGLYLGTLNGFILNYDTRINTISNYYKYSNNKPIIGISNYNSRHGFGFPNKYPNMRNYLMIWTGSDDHEISLWNKEDFNCEILFKVNKTYSSGLDSIIVEIPEIEKEYYNSNEKKLFNIMYSYNKLKYLDNKTYTKNKGLIFSKIKNDYSNIEERIKNITNIYQNPSTVQTVFSPMNLNSENYPYIISAGNDMTIRYWSIINENNLNKEENQENFSYLINAPENMSNCFFTKSIFGENIILQSNEIFNIYDYKKSVIGFSEYQLFNGITCHTSIQNEFKEELNVTLNYCTRISDSSHKNVISDIIPMALKYDIDDGLEKYSNLLISSSWDGTVKIWK